ncbi:MAG: hypothetical protein K6F77_09945 [Lachnospiraceae bacterium]|nr:hypothetical protein [Lachnospiraceae bacterium]
MEINVKRKSNEKLLSLLERFDKESLELFKDPPPTWQDEAQWYADMMNDIADELERRGVEVEIDWFRNWKL